MIKTTLILLSLSNLFACDRSSHEAAAEPEIYTVRAKVEGTTGTGDERYLSLRHEAIPTFRDRDGNTVGMHSMVMNFEVGPEVSLDQVTPGDAVEVRFEMHWQGGRELQIVALSKLPEGTSLDLETGESHHAH